MYDKMKHIGSIVANVFNEIETFLKPGISTKDIENECVRLLTENGAQSSCKGYYGFTGELCISINNEVCHGIPKPTHIIKHNDMISIDIVANKGGYNGDSCVTFLLGEDKTKKKIMKDTYECMWNAIAHIKSGIRVGDLSYLMESYANRAGYNVVKDFCGHGIGQKMHEDPQIPFYGRRNTGEVLLAGQYITIEPMLLIGSAKVKIMPDQWTAVTQGLSCQFEHTICIHEDGYEVMTYNKYDAINNKLQKNTALDLFR